MAEVDLDVQAALQERDDAARTVRIQFANARDDLWREPALMRLRTAQIYVWEPRAIEELERFWAKPANAKRFRDLCYNGRTLRFIAPLLQPSFHVCPADGFFLRDVVPPELTDPWTEALFQPTTRVISVSVAEPDQRKFLAGLLGTTHLSKQRVNVRNWQEIERRIAGTPRRNLMRSQLMQFEVESRFPRVEQGMIHHAKPLDWVERLYQMLLFIEQPYVGVTRTRPPGDKKRGPLLPNEPAEVVKVHMREALPRFAPKVIFPTVSRINGRPLEFEVDVKSHLRKLRSGLVVPVRAYTRGPKGVKRERVVKIVR